MRPDPRAIAARLACWSRPIEPEPLAGGITNSNFLVEHGRERYFVRVGNDIPEHGVMRFHELAASQAAWAAGVSPEVVHHEPGAIVLRFIEGRSLRPEDVLEPETLARIVPLVKRCHEEIPKHFRGPALAFWVFQVIRDYAHTLRAGPGRRLDELPRLVEIAARLERAVGPVSLVFGHNDLLAANLLDDGQRLWLIDWDYAGFNSPLFDLSGLASNNELPTEQEEWVLAHYFDAPVGDDLRHRFAAMKCASLLRESLWSLVSERRSRLDFDYAAYTDANLERFEAALSRFEGL
jgi:thiamine kinase-like enzyme